MSYHCSLLLRECSVSINFYLCMYTTVRASTASSACNTLDTIEKRQFVVVTTASSLPTAINTMTLPLTFRLQCWGLHQSIYNKLVYTYSAEGPASWSKHEWKLCLLWLESDRQHCAHKQTTLSTQTDNTVQSWAEVCWCAHIRPIEQAE